jgi:hypothetical protein
MRTISISPVGQRIILSPAKMKFHETSKILTISDFIFEKADTSLNLILAVFQFEKPISSNRACQVQFQFPSAL